MIVPQKYVIGLERSPQRTARFYRSNEHLEDVTYYQGIDGKRIKPGQYKGFTSMVDGKWMRGSIGCALSHVALWSVCDSRQKPLTVFETDAVSCKNFDEESIRILNLLPEDWDFILWGFNFNAPTVVNMTPAEIPFFIKGDNKWTNTKGDKNELFKKYALTYNQHRIISAGVLPLSYAFGTTCYSISPKGARKLLAQILPFRNDTTKILYNTRVLEVAGIKDTDSIDLQMKNVYKFLKAYVTFPPLVVTPHDGQDSDITEKVKPSDKKENEKQEESKKSGKTSTEEKKTAAKRQAPKKNIPQKKTKKKKK